MGATQSKEFFAQLDEFSDRYVRKHIGLGVSPRSPWGGALLGTVTGAVLHYTASRELAGVINWFVKPACDARVSAHVVIDDGRVPDHGELAVGLPLVFDLPVTVVSCRSWRLGAWHAVGCNGWSYGIELVNQGCLPAGSLPENAAPRKSEAVLGRAWVPYSGAQLAATVQVLRYLRDLPNTAFRPEHIIGHEQVQGVDTLRSDGTRLLTDKRDPGPLFPLHAIRADTFSSAVVAPTCGVWPTGDFCAERVAAALGADYEGPAAVGDLGVFGWLHYALLEDGTRMPAWSNVVARSALHTLGYHVPEFAGTVFAVKNLEFPLTACERDGVRLFQRLAGIADDGEVGPETRRALAARLVDRGWCHA